MEIVPTLDIGAHRRGELTQQDREALDRACADHGFFLLVGHGLDDVLAEMWTQTERFFAAPRAVKHSVLRDADNPLGYYDRELTKRKRDQKEVFDFKAGGHQSKRPERQSRWPIGDDWVAFRSALTDYFTASTQLAEEVMLLVGDLLGVDESVVRAVCTDQHTSSARLNYYPVDDPLPAAERGEVNALGDMALHHHTDPGAVTLLVQDAVGGLQALSREDGWIDVPPLAGSIVLNLGDCMQAWSNDRYRAAVHRVLPMRGQARYSTPFFYQPRFDVVIEPWLTDEAPRYRPFTWRELILGRVTDNYSDLGEEDIQVTKYRIAS